MCYANDSDQMDQVRSMLKLVYFLGGLLHPKEALVFRPMQKSVKKTL